MALVATMLSGGEGEPLGEWGRISNKMINGMQHALL